MICSNSVRRICKTAKEGCAADKMVVVIKPSSQLLSVVHQWHLVKNKKKFLCHAGLAFLVVCCVTYFLFYTQLTLLQNEGQPSTYLTIEITSTERQSQITYLVDGTRFYPRVDTQHAAVNQSLRVQPILIERTNLTANEQYLIDYFTTGRKTYPGVENYIRYTVARLGLSPLVHVDPLIPEFGPVINDVLSFEYPISIPPCRKNLNVNQTIVILVNSAPGNFDRRKIIRQTWKNRLNVLYEENVMGIAGFAFVLGLTDDNVTQIKIEQEAKTYNDVIQIGMKDFYRNLSMKVAGLFNWLYKFCAKVDFVVKVDDDVYVNMRNVAQFFRSYNPSKSLAMFGTAAGNLWPVRDGKWKMSYHDWPWKTYPPYFLGPAVLFPGSVIVPLLAAFQTTPMMPIDDIYYTGICTEKAGVKLYFSSNSTNFFATKLPDFPAGCDLHRIVTWLTVSANHMNSSHVATEDFYQNTTQCIVTNSNGIKAD